MEGFSDKPTGRAMAGGSGGSSGRSPGDNHDLSAQPLRRRLSRTDGDYIGKPGGRGRRARHIRKLPIDEYEPESFFADLAEGGREREGTSYPGRLVELPGVGTMGLRPPEAEKPYTMDVNINGIRINEWKFVDREDYEA